MVKYLGSKRQLIANILELAANCEGVRSILDVFSGTSRVGHAFKGAGYQVFANDHNAYAHCLARCYVQADAEDWKTEAERLLAELNALPGEPGYVTETFCVQSRFFKPENGARIDAIRERIFSWGLEPELEGILLTSLLEAADRVDSTTGLQMAYLKSWAPRASNPLELRMPDVLPRAKHGKGHAVQMEAHLAAQTLAADLAYLDPPYNQHSYRANYHIWESLVRWDKPEVYGVACKRIDTKDTRSPFNSRPGFAQALEQVVMALQCKYLLVSFNDEGFLSEGEMREMLAKRGLVEQTQVDYRRYVGAQIGIHNPQGKKVGRVGRLRNTENLFLVRVG